MALETVSQEADRKPISVILHAELYAKLRSAAENRSTPSRRVTMVDIIRELIDQHC